MAFRDAAGRLTGFSVEVARAVCAEMKVQCEFQVMVLDRVVDALEEVAAQAGKTILGKPTDQDINWRGLKAKRGVKLQRQNPPQGRPG